MSDESKIREALHEAHASDAPPPFAQTWAAARARVAEPRRSWTWPRLVVTAGAITAAIAALTYFVREPVAEDPALSLAFAWTAPTEFLLPARAGTAVPTDFLLATPGREHLRSLPSIGGTLHEELQ